MFLFFLFYTQHEPRKQEEMAEDQEPAAALDAIKCPRKKHARTNLHAITEQVRRVQRDSLPPSTSSISRPRGDDLFLFQADDENRSLLLQDGLRWTSLAKRLYLHESLKEFKRRPSKVSITYRSTKESEGGSRVIGRCDKWAVFLRGPNHCLTRNSMFQKHTYVFYDEKVVAVHYVGDHTVIN
jgi:hypothetical protein